MTKAKAKRVRTREQDAVEAPVPAPAPTPALPVRVGAAIVIHAFGDRVGRYGCGGVTSDERTQPEPLRELDPTERAAACQLILSEMDKMRVTLAGVIGGRATVEICRGCRSNATSGLAAARHALGHDDSDSDRTAFDPEG